MRFPAGNATLVSGSLTSYKSCDMIDCAAATWTFLKIIKVAEIAPTFASFPALHLWCDQNFPFSDPDFHFFVALVPFLAIKN